MLFSIFQIQNLSLFSTCSWEAGQCITSYIRCKHMTESHMCRRPETSLLCGLRNSSADYRSPYPRKVTGYHYRIFLPAPPRCSLLYLTLLTPRSIFPPWKSPTSGKSQYQNWEFFKIHDQAFYSLWIPPKLVREYFTLSVKN